MKNIFIRLNILISFFLAGSAVSLNSPDTYKDEILKIHNEFRAKHQAPPLVWDDRLANFAERYASKCFFKHSHAGYGENIATNYRSLEAAINAWYAEGIHYDYRHPGFTWKTGHFTQLVWKATERIGCGYVACDGKNGTNGKFLVCEYMPHGNVLSQEYFENNVLAEK